MNAFEKKLSNYPELTNFLKSDNPSEVEAQKFRNKTYKISSTLFNGPATIIEICAYLGKINHIKAIRFDNLRQAVLQNDYLAIQLAALHGHTNIIQYLESDLSPEEKKEAFMANFYAATQNAIINGHTETLKHIESYLSQEEKKEAFMAADYLAIQITIDKGHENMLHHLLKIDVVLAWLESQREHGETIIYPYIKEQCLRLREEKTKFELANPNAIFDVVKDRAHCLFYMARNLIRRNDETLTDDFLLLLNLPSVKAMAATSVNGEPANELFRLAQDVGNEELEGILLNIPAVQEEAMRHNFYMDKNRNSLNLQQLAEDTESSILALTAAEQRRLNAAIFRYGPMRKNAGVDNIIDDLRNTLRYRYEKDPIVFTSKNNDTITLPMEFSEFQKLELSTNDQKKACQAYYQNKNHTAWRFLAKPNPWIHPNALYADSDKSDQEKWSGFETYASLIATLYLAAQDKKTKPTEDYSLDDRLTCFITELAFIGRAHNWDNKKLIETLQTDGTIVTTLVQYDDLEADNPSCPAGIKRHLLQSVQGHPLLMILTEDILKQALNDFLFSHMKQHITQENYTILQSAWDKGILLEKRTEAETKILRTLNIPKEKIEKWLQKLSKKYGSQFDQNFKQSLEKALSLNEHIENTSSHFLKFGHLIKTLFEKSETSHPKVSSHSSFNSLQYNLFSPEKTGEEKKGKILDTALSNFSLD